MAKKQEIAPAVKSNLPDFMQKYQGAGQEDIDREDILMPRLKLGQKMTPEVGEGRASDGDFIHTITGEVYGGRDKPIKFIPIAYNKEYVLWRDRKTGGGIIDRATKVKTPEGLTRYKWREGNKQVEDKIGGSAKVSYDLKTFIDEDNLNAWGTKIPGDADSPPAATEHHNYVVMLPEYDNEMVAISLSKTSTGMAKKLNTMLKTGNAPTFGRIFEMKSVEDSRGDDEFSNYDIRPAGLVEDPAFFEELYNLHTGLKEKGINVEYGEEDATPKDDEAF